MTVHAEPAVCCHHLLHSNLGITLVHDSEHGLSSRDSVDLPSGFGLGFGTGVRALWPLFGTQADRAAGMRQALYKITLSDSRHRSTPK